MATEAMVIPPTPAHRGTLLSAATRACPACARPVVIVEGRPKKRPRVLCVEHKRLSGWVVLQHCANGGLWVTAEVRAASEHCVFYDSEFNYDGNQNPEPIAWADWIAQDLSRFAVSAKSEALDRAYREEHRVLHVEMYSARRERSAKLKAKKRRAIDERNAEKREWLADAPARRARSAAARVERERARVEGQRLAIQARAKERKPREVWIADREDSFAAA